VFREFRGPAFPGGQGDDPLKTRNIINRMEFNPGATQKGPKHFCFGPNWNLSLEGITETNLHYPRRSLNGCEIRPIRGWSGCTWIECDTSACASNVHLSKVLGVGHIESLPANLKFVILTPWKAKGLAQSKVKTDITGQSEGIAISRLAWECVSETLISRGWIAAK